MKYLLVILTLIAVGCDNPTTPEKVKYYTDESGNQLRLYESGKFQWNDISGKYKDITDSLPPGHPYERIYLFEKDTIWIMYVTWEGESLAYVSKNGISYITYKEQ